MNPLRNVWLWVALSVWSSPSLGNDSDCWSLWAVGWYVCSDGNDVGAVPHELLLESRMLPHQSFPMIWCSAPPWWKVWGERELTVVFLSGNLHLPTGDITVWVGFKSGHGYPTKFKPYAAVGEVRSDEHGRFHHTLVEGDFAREIAHRSKRGVNTAMHWKWGQGKKHVSVGIATLGGPLGEVLRSCPNPTGG